MLQATTPTASDAWVSPDGRFYEVFFGGHSTAARELGDETGGEELENMGWAHISGGAILTTKRLTQAQLDVLWDMETQYQASDKFYRTEFHRAFTRAVERDS